MKRKRDEDHKPSPFVESNFAWNIAYATLLQYLRAGQGGKLVPPLDAHWSDLSLTYPLMPILPQVRLCCGEITTALLSALDDPNALATIPYHIFQKFHSDPSLFRVTPEMFGLFLWNSDLWYQRPDEYKSFLEKENCFQTNHIICDSDVMKKWAQSKDLILGPLPGEEESIYAIFKIAIPANILASIKTFPPHFYSYPQERHPCASQVLAPILPSSLVALVLGYVHEQGVVTVSCYSPSQVPYSPVSLTDKHEIVLQSPDCLRFLRVEVGEDRPHSQARHTGIREHKKNILRVSAPSPLGIKARDQDVHVSWKEEVVLRFEKTEQQVKTGIFVCAPCAVMCFPHIIALVFNHSDEKEMLEYSETGKLIKTQIPASEPQVWIWNFKAQTAKKLKVLSGDVAVVYQAVRPNGLILGFKNDREKLQIVMLE